MSTAHHGGLGALDLNLLVHLDALLAEAHVTRAARRAGVTQSAMSRSLGRLRDLLGDPLLVRGRAGMTPTPRARALAAPLRRALDELQAVVLDRPSFDPATATRTFTVVSSDYGDALLLPALLARLSREAPGVDVAAVNVGRDQAFALEDDSIDLSIGPRRGGGASVVWKKLYHEDFLCVLRAGHPVLRARGGLTFERFCELPQVLVAPGGRPGSILDDELARRGRRRRVAVRVASFLVAPQVVAESDLVVTLPERLARRVATQLPVRLVPTPLPLPGFDISMGWHERFQKDAGHQWFRELVAGVAATL